MVESLVKKIEICLVALLLLICPLVSADTPYRSYDDSEWSTQLAAPDAYDPAAAYTGMEMGCGALNSPSDVMVGPDGYVYVADTGNNRIVVLDSQMKMCSVIDKLTDESGKTGKFRQPSSVYVTGDAIYVADTGNSRCVKITKEGKLLQEWVIPSDKMYTSDTFSPTDILADAQGTVYVIAKNISEGIMMYTSEGVFVGYYGSPRVTATFQLLWNKFWKNFLTDEQRSGLSRYVPVEYSGFTIDEAGFIYASLSYTDDNKEQIRKLNYLGNNVLAYKKNFGEEERVNYKKDTWYTKFVDIDVDDTFIYALDSQWQRIYLYSADGKRLAAFGTTGEQLGSFRNATALSVKDGCVYVLDKGKGNITVFKPTAYGSSILQAVTLYNEGSYSEAVEPWKQVLSMDANSELAYTGIGEAYLKTKDYGLAVKYFRLAYNRERESAAFGYLRSEWIREHVIEVLTGLLIVLVAIILFTNKHFLAFLKSKQKKKGNSEITAWQNLRRMVLSALVRPVEGFNELKNIRYQNGWMVLGIMAAWLLIKIWKRQCYGFCFNMNDPDDFSIFIQIATTIIPFFLFVIANWAVCALTDGEGRFGEIATVTSLSLAPYLVFTAVSVPLSLIMTLNESVFLNSIQAIGILWSCMLLFQSQRIVHNFSGGKTIGMAFLTICGIAVILVILLLLFSLGQQVVYFFTTVYSELQFRK